MEQRQQKTPREAAIECAETGRKIAACVWDAIAAEKPDDADILAVYAERLASCNSTGNIWTATDLHNEHGEAFDGNGRFWFCGSKLCSYCLKKQSNRSRKLLREAIAEQHFVTPHGRRIEGLPVGQHYHFLTLTMPKQGISILNARAILNYAWALFRKRTWFKNTIIGGGKSEEFTQSKKGTHYHMHALVRSRYINYSSFRHIWTECLDSAFRQCGYNLSIATTDSLAIANCKRVGSVEDAIKEVAKYLTKCTSWAQIEPDQLLNLCRIERWPRMFELFGSFRLPQPVAVPEGEDEQALLRLSLDTKQISDEDPDAGWRNEVRRVGVAEYLSKLEETQNDQTQVRLHQLRRHYGAAKFKRVRTETSINIERTLKRIRQIYDNAGRPPPPTLRHGLTLEQKLAINHKTGIALNDLNKTTI